MATMKFNGLDEYLQRLEKLNKETPEMLGKIIYNMADIVADEVRAGIESLKAVPDAYALGAYRKNGEAPLTVSQKKGLEKGFGITKMEEDNGYYHVKLGFAGYNEIKTKKYPKGQPNAVIARAIESGSSMRTKTPFVRPAVNRSRKAAEAKAQKIIDEEINAL